MHSKLYLASSSPRRLALMRQIRLDPQVISLSVDESRLPNESIESYVRRLAVEKAQAGFDSVPEKTAWVIGGDTVVALGDEDLGKPRNKAEYLRMLTLLSGNAHQVLTGVAVVHDGVVHSTVNSSQVVFGEIPSVELEAYWATGEPKDKAGGYGIQGYAAKWVKHIEGSYTGIMGLPLYELAQLLKEAGYYADA